MKRVHAIIDLIENPFQIIIDVGADHGYLGIESLLQNKANEIWNVEITKSCLSNSIKNFKKYKLFSSAKFYLSDGFISIPDVPDNCLCIIAGLGTKTILKILNNKIPAKLTNIIFLPHNPPIAIRRWAVENNWSITHEHYFEDRNQIYLIIKIQKTNRFKLNNIYLGNLDFLNKQPHLSKKYWNKLKNKILKKPESALLVWEKEFLLSWNDHINNIDLK